MNSAAFARHRGVRITFQLILVTVGSFITAFAINSFLVPAQLLSGGIAGISIILQRLYGLPVGTMFFVFNIPILILSYKYVGRKFSLYTIYGTTMLSVFLDTIHIPLHWTHDALLLAIFGGVISGAGSSIVLRFGGSQGGTDALSRVIASQRNISIAKFGLTINALIVAVSAGLFSVQSAMFTLISMYASARVYEVILHHVDRITVLIVTDKGHEVSDAITHFMHRGVTVWDARGAYTDQSKQVLLCVIVKAQWPEVHHIIKAVDVRAFAAVMPATDVVGRFRSIW